MLLILLRYKQFSKSETDVLLQTVKPILGLTTITTDDGVAEVCKLCLHGSQESTE